MEANKGVVINTQPIVTLGTIDIPKDGKQARVTVKSYIIQEMLAAGATKMCIKKCGLHISIDPVFDIKEK